MRTKKPLISISIPVLNEEDNHLFLYDRLDALSKKMSELCDIEFVFSDNHSDDRTWDILQDLSSKDDRIKGIRFSKNYGFQRSIFANYIHTSGDAVMQIDVLSCLLYQCKTLCLHTEWVETVVAVGKLYNLTLACAHRHVVGNHQILHAFD